VSVERFLIRLWLLAHIAAIAPVAAVEIRAKFEERLHPIDGPAHVEYVRHDVTHA
jgi:hypothetical protein